VRSLRAPRGLKISGGSDNVSFHVVRTANNATNKIQWKGTIHGEEIHFTRSVEGAPGPGMEIIAKRAQ
jgi:hypothetical protein